LTGNQPDKIVGAIKILYDSSATFRRWVDTIIASGGKLRFGAATVDPPNNTPGSTRAIGEGATGYTNLNFSTIDTSCWINTAGELVQEKLEITIAHELSHLFELSKDAAKPFTNEVRNQAEFQGWVPLGRFARIRPRDLSTFVSPHLHPQVERKGGLW
jgi:hypothetical protein